MNNSVLRIISRLSKSAYLQNKEAATALEYSLIAAGVALSIVVVLFAFGDQLVTTYETMEPAMSSMSAQIPDVP